VKTTVLVLLIGGALTAIMASSPVWSAVGALVALGTIFGAFTTWLVGDDIKAACKAAEHEKAA
jgi:hypothetical protein